MVWPYNFFHASHAEDEETGDREVKKSGPRSKRKGRTQT
jgi:hypothetical protein